MIKVAQTKFGKDEGNCLSACIASLLEMPIEDVPTFLSRVTWMWDLNEWLLPRSLYYLEIPWNPFPSMLAGPILCLAGGPSPRDPSFDHCVVCEIRPGKTPVDVNLEIVWDPHPDGTGVKKVIDIGFLIPVDPAKFGPTTDGAKSDPDAKGQSNE